MTTGSNVPAYFLRSTIPVFVWLALVCMVGVNECSVHHVVVSSLADHVRERDLGTPGADVESQGDEGPSCPSR